MMTDLRNRVARAMAYANRQKLDASADADDHWQHACVETQNMWLKLAYDAYRRGQQDALDGIRVADPRVILSRVRAIAEGKE